jgi:hypothetical protein
MISGGRRRERTAEIGICLTEDRARSAAIDRSREQLAGWRQRILTAARPQGAMTAPTQRRTRNVVTTYLFLPATFRYPAAASPPFRHRPRTSPGAAPCRDFHLSAFEHHRLFIIIDLAVVSRPHLHGAADTDLQASVGEDQGNLVSRFFDPPRGHFREGDRSSQSPLSLLLRVFPPQAEGGGGGQSATASADLSCISL